MNMSESGNEVIDPHEKGCSQVIAVIVLLILMKSDHIIYK